MSKLKCTLKAKSWKAVETKKRYILMFLKPSPIGADTGNGRIVIWYMQPVKSSKSENSCSNKQIACLDHHQGKYTGVWGRAMKLRYGSKYVMTSTSNFGLALFLHRNYNSPQHQSYTSLTNLNLDYRSVTYCAHSPHKGSPLDARGVTSGTCSNFILWMMA